MDRRTLLTGSAAAVLGALGVGRVVTTRSDGPTPPSSPSPPPPGSVAGSPAPPRGDGGQIEEEAATPVPEPTSEPEAPPATPLVVPVLCRDAWGARPAGEGLRTHTLRRMTVHHTAVPLRDDRQAPARLRQHQRFHQDQGWPDIAYHLGVDRRGNRYELRTVTSPGDTFTDYDPTGHLLVLAEGNFDEHQPTDAQLEALAELLAWGATEHGLPLDTVTGHRDHASTSCPGDALYARLPDLRGRAAQLAAHGVEVRSVCGDEGRAAVAGIETGATDG